MSPPFQSPTTTMKRHFDLVCPRRNERDRNRSFAGSRGAHVRLVRNLSTALPREKTRGSRQMHLMAAGADTARCSGRVVPLPYVPCFLDPRPRRSRRVRERGWQRGSSSGVCSLRCFLRDSSIAKRMPGAMHSRRTSKPSVSGRFRFAHCDFPVAKGRV